MKRWTKKHRIRIPYRYLGRKRKYIPDILVEYHDGKLFLEEVKGFVFRKFQFESKNFAAQKFCALNGIRFRIIYSQDLDKVV